MLARLIAEAVEAAPSSTPDGVVIAIVTAIGTVIGVAITQLGHYFSNRKPKNVDEAEAHKLDMEAERATAETFKTTFEGVDSAVNSLLRLVQETQSRLDTQNSLTAQLTKKLDQQDAELERVRAESAEMRRQLQALTETNRRQAHALEVLTRQLRALNVEPKVEIPVE